MTNFRIKNNSKKKLTRLKGGNSPGCHAELVRCVPTTAFSRVSIVSQFGRRKLNLSHEVSAVRFNELMLKLNLGIVKSVKTVIRQIFQITSILLPRKY